MSRTILVSIPVLLLACRADNTLKTFNSEPSAEITSHSDGDEVLEGYTESFRGAVSDPDDGADDLTATWYLDDVVLCESAAPDADGISTCEAVIPADASEITLEAQDPDNAAGSDQVTLSVVPTEAPEAEITAPSADGIYYSDQKITFAGIVSDGEDAATDLVVAWESDLDGVLDLDAVPDAEGEFADADYLTEGEHFLTLTATDTTGKPGSDNVTIVVGPSNSAPSCEITAPEDGSSGEEGDTVIFEATVSDVDVPSDWLAVTWESDKDDVLGESNPDSTGAVAFLYSDLSVDSHVITLSVADEVGATCSSFVIYTVGTPPSLSIDSPTSGDVVDDGDLISFLATVSDNEDAPTDLSLSWVSDLDGEFSTQGADSTGAIAFNDSGLSVGTHSITVTVTDTDGFYASALLTIRVNGIPTSPEVELGPDPADTTDDLVVSIISDATDADGDPISYRYAWYVDGVASSASTSATLDASETTKGQTWTVEVTPDDGITEGTAGSDDLTIGNTVPEITSVVIYPDPAYPDDELSCAWSFYDEDGDADASTLEWTIDGTTVGTDSTLSGVFTVDDEVICTVTAHDGEDTGSSDSASVTITNTAPEVTEVTLSPSEVFTDDTLTASVSTDDAEGDSVSLTYEWYVDGSLVSETGSTLDGATYFDKDEAVYVVVTPSDDWESGSALSSDSIVVLNTPPTAPEIALGSAGPASCDALYLDGSDDYIDLDEPSSLDFAENGDFTFEAWVKLDSFSSTVFLLDRGDDYGAQTNRFIRVFIGGEGLVNFGIRGSSGESASATVTSSTTLTAGQWHHIAVVREYGSGLYIYIDGALDASTSDGAGEVSFSSSRPWNIGRKYDDSTYYLGGYLSELRFWSQARTSSEISDTITAPLSGSESSLGAYWPLDDGSGSIAADATGAGADGTLENSPVWESGSDLCWEEGSDMVCLVETESTDADGDDISYTFEWEVDGTAYTDATTTYETGDTVYAEDMIGGEEWTCTVTPHDGDEDGSSATASITIEETGCSEQGVYADFEIDAACPVAHWDMSSLDSVDRPEELIGGSNSLDIYGSPTEGVDGVIGTTYQISSSSDYFISENAYPTVLQGSSSKSISAWTMINTKHGDGDGVSAIAGFGASSSCTSGSFALSYTTEGTWDNPRFVACSDDLLGGDSWDVDEWHHMVATYDGSTMVVYIDGVEESSESKSLYTDTYFDYVTVGTDPWWSAGEHYMSHGRVDEVKIYDYTLSASEVEELYELTD